MIWQGTSVQDKTDLIFNDGPMNAQQYIHDVIQPVVLAYVQSHQKITLMDGNVPALQARVGATFMQQHNIEHMNP